MAFKGVDVTPEKKTGLFYKGREIILSKTRGRPLTGLTGKAMQERGIYPEMKRIEAASLYAVLGDAVQVAKLTDIPESTIRSWRKQEWFQLVLKEVWSENNAALNTKLTQNIDKAQEQLTDRLDNGDTKVLKDGTLVKVPISGKDLSLIAAINFDKRQIVRGEPTTRSETVSSGDKQITRLEQLAETFENLTLHKRKKTDIVDAEVIEVKEHGAQAQT